jgi:tetratricopeptide (TPR) repeat protein
MISVLCLLCLSLAATEPQSRTVVGSTNPELQQGAEALLAEDAEEGVRLTLIGLRHASSKRERVVGLSNLCAGYVMLENFDTAFDYCARALEENDAHWRTYSNRAAAYIKTGRFEEAEQDLQKAEALSPNSRTVKVVRAMLLNQTNPVEPVIVIDDRRQHGDNPDE